MIARTREEEKVLREGGRRLGLILKALQAAVAPGRSGLFFETLARELAKKYEVRPAFLGHQKFPAALCVSVNEVVVHGVPNETPLQAGDLVSFDFGVQYPAKTGLFTDAALTVGVGLIEPAKHRLLEVTQTALKNGLKKARAGWRLGDISSAIEQTVTAAGLGLVRQLVGHGVGAAVHEPPQVPNFGRAGQGETLADGLVLAVEPMVTLGSGQVKLAPDGFAYVSADGAVSAHAEHTVIITPRGAEILTQP